MNLTIESQVNRNILFEQQKRINKRSRNEQQRQIDTLLNRNTNKIYNETNSVNTTENSAMNRTALFVTCRNRCKNKNNARRSKSNCLRHEQRELLEQLSKAKNVILPEDMFHPINLTDQQLTEDELNMCKLGLKFIAKIKRYDRVKKWMDIQAFK